jgi:adenine C2-methylase RlmN of 23S rRNA A2503 and tRNA A37
MTDDRRRRDEERLRRAQEIANALREQQAELAASLHATAQRARKEPVVLAEWRRAHAVASWSLPDDAG